MKRKEAIILVSDIRNYSDLCSKVQLPSLSDSPSMWSGDVNKIVEENKGTLDKFIGDSVLVYWALSNPSSAIGNNFGRKQIEKTSLIR